MVLFSRRSRTVVDCLVACRGPVRPAGLGAVRLPGAWWGGGFPGCGPWRRDDPGPRLGWPCREAARPLASSRPSPQRAARSRLASDPRCRPTAHRTASSCADTRSRVRTRTPAGAAATNGSAIGRRTPVTSPPPTPRTDPQACAYIRRRSSCYDIVSYMISYSRHTEGQDISAVYENAG